MEYKIEVKPWMMQKSTSDFQFMKEWNNDIPMPLKIMYGVKLGETKGMVRMSLHGDIKDKITQRCMMCGKPITNPVSKFFGLGPICGDHNYTNPFDTEEELAKAVEDFRIKLVNTTWTGWIAKSAILSIDDNSDVVGILNRMPMENTTSTTNTKNSAFLIEVTIGDPTRCTEDYSAYVSFKYDARIVSAVKELPIRYWDAETKKWEIPYSNLVILKKNLPHCEFKVSGAERVKVQEAKLPKGFEFKTKPYAHQVDGVLYGMGKSRWLLGDHQGLGKTMEIINLACARKISDNLQHCLIICGVNSLKWNWLAEITKHSNEQGRLLGQKITRNGKLKVGSNADKLVDAAHLDTFAEYFIITNVESLRNEQIADALNAACANGTIGMVAIDEVHRVKNLNTQSGTGILKLNPKYRVAMTGTPLMNSPLDLYAIMKWLGYESHSYYAFKNYFCNFDKWGGVCGYKHLSELESQLNSIMLRRTKEQVLDLPDKVYIDEYVEMTPEQEKIYNTVCANVIAELKELEVPTVQNVLAKMLRLRQVTGGCGVFNILKSNPKLDRVEQIVEEAIYSGTKVVVFSNWQEMVDEIIPRLTKYNPIVFTGDTNDSDRQFLIDKFQNDANCKVIVGTIGALGTGVTLTAGTEVVFVDQPWSKALVEQAVDRCHRIGTTSTITVHTIMCHDTIDEHIHEIVQEKGVLADNLVDGGESYQYKSIAKYLVSALLSH